MDFYNTNNANNANNPNTPYDTTTLFSPLAAPQKRPKNYLLRRMALKVLSRSLIYLILLVSVMYLGYLWGESRIWNGREFGYYFLRYVEKNTLIVGFTVFSIGFFVIFAWYFYRMGTYFQEITNAMERIQSQDDIWITLSDDLHETAAHMNRIKNDIRQSRMQAKEAEQRKNDLVVYLAHDLKTPLTSVLGYLSILEESPELPDKQRARYLDIARRKAERLEDLINEFFEITRFNLTNVELELRQINFSLLLKQTVFEFRPMLDAKHLTCRLETPTDVSLYCDLDKIQRVVDNLLRNACFYAYEETEILLELRQTPTDDIRFTCTNKGPTIPAEKLERIFEQFYRLDSARSSAGGGAGLGLAIARQIVQLHGGTIRAESMDETTAFIVELPRGNSKNHRGLKESF